MLCVVLASAVASAAESKQITNPCLAADASSDKQIVELRKVKAERQTIRVATSLKPWMDKVKQESKTARGTTTAGLKVCRADEALGPRTRRAAVTRLKKRLREIDEVDEQMMMMQALGHPQPRIDPSVLRALEK